MRLKAPAKINLALDITGIRDNGYHEVDMIMQTVKLADEITLTPTIRDGLTCTNPDVPCDDTNLCLKALNLLRTVSSHEEKMQIDIIKNIPMAAGLAGGSADAAAVLVGLNEMWGLGYSREKLMEIGVRLGADVPYCILQQTARAQGIGEVLTPIKSRLKTKVFLVTPNVAVATPLVYKKRDATEITHHPRVEMAIEALECGSLPNLFDNWGNVLQEVVLREFPVVSEVFKAMFESGMKYCLMSGSGPSVFALDPSEEAIEQFNLRKPQEWFATVTEFTD